MAATDAPEAFDDRDLEQLREREKSYRTRLWQSEALASRLRTHMEAMQRTLRERPPTRASLERTLEEVARIACEALDVPRASLWFFDDARSSLCCRLLLEDGEVARPEGLRIDCAEARGFVQTLSSEFALAVADAAHDPRTRELAGYLEANRIGAVLAIPIVLPNRLLGVLCHEHLREVRAWHERESDFAASVAHLVALTLSTERRILAESAARQSEARYRDLVEALPVVVYAFDAATGELNYLSPQVEGLTGRGPDAWKAMGPGAWIRQIHTEDRAPVLDRFDRGGEGGFADEVTYRFTRTDGEQVWIRDNCRVVRDVGGQPLAIQGVLLDVTESVRAELSRVEFERRYRTLLENVDLFAVSLDREGRVTYANPTFLRAVGLSSDAVVGQDYFELTLREEQRTATRERYMSKVALDTVDARFELDLETPHQGTRRLLCTATPLRDEAGAMLGSSTLALDVTERRKLETELLVHTKLESLGRLAAGVAHDFNNLLTVLMSQVDLLRRRAAQDAAFTPHLDSMDQVLNQARDLTQALMLYGKREKTVQAKKVALDPLIEEARPLLEAIAGKRCTLHLALGAPQARLDLDVVRVRQVLMNLVGNAADAVRGPHGHIRISTHCDLLDEEDAMNRGARQGGEFLVLTVADDGCGMDEATLGAAFEPFFTTKPDGRGTGLGLAITQSLVNQMGGFAEVESQLQEGTTFRLYLPLVATPSRVRAARSDKRPPRVLVVHPSLAMRAELATPLGGLGYEVRTAANMRDATEMLADDSIDLLVIEQRLPDGFGSVLARSARQVHAALQVVLVADEPLDDDGIDAVLVRPFDQASLAHVARLALELGRA